MQTEDDVKAMQIADNLVNSNFNIILLAFSEQSRMVTPFFQSSFVELMAISRHVEWIPFAYEARVLPIMLQGTIDIGKALKSDPRIQLRELFVQLLPSYDTINIQIYPCGLFRGSSWCALHNLLEIDLPPAFDRKAEDPEDSGNDGIDLMLLKTAATISLLASSLTSKEVQVRRVC